MFERFCEILLLAFIVAQPTANPAVLEPSVQNEVDHALSRVPSECWAAATNRPPSAAETGFVRLFETNGSSATEMAIRLVSSQKADGTWRFGTNDVTSAALRLFLKLGH